MNHRNESELKLTIIQINTIWCDIEKNLALLDQLMYDQLKQTDIILLPEMFATGYTLQPGNLTTDQQQLVIEWMKSTASAHNCSIAGTHPYSEGGIFFNRLLFYSSDGTSGSYDKRHLFPMEGENLVYKKGRERKIIEWKSWKILPLICYDLRFPVWSRNNDNYDLLIYSSNWPAARNQAWEVLLKARAIENQCFVAGINRTGTDGNKIRYIGNSQVISPTGDILGQLGTEEGILHISLNREILTRYRKQFPVLNDRDEFEIRL